MTTYAIGDIHAQYDALMLLLEKIKYSDSDELWFVGDFINRGDKSLEVLRFLLELKRNKAKFKTVIGNHDFSLMVQGFGVDKGRVKKVVKEILDSPEAGEILEMLISWDLAFYNPDKKIFLSHAGLYPLWDIKTALALNQDYRKAITQAKGEEVKDFFQAVYRNGKNLWADNLKPLEKICFTVNALSRMRFLTVSEKALDFDCKISPQDAPTGLIPWYELLPPNMEEKIIFGHWAALGYSSGKNWLCLDGGAAWDGDLIAWNVDSWQLAGKAKCKKN